MSEVSKTAACCCPHVFTAHGPQRSGWAKDCAIHGSDFPPVMGLTFQAEVGWSKPDPRDAAPAEKDARIGELQAQREADIAALNVKDAEIATLSAELERVKADNLERHRVCGELRAEKFAAEQRVKELERFITGLRHYSQHKDHCGDQSAHYDEEHRCGCGLDFLQDTIDAAISSATPEEALLFRRACDACLGDEEVRQHCWECKGSGLLLGEK